MPYFEETIMQLVYLISRAYLIAQYGLRKELIYNPSMSDLRVKIFFYRLTLYIGWFSFTLLAKKE